MRKSKSRFCLQVDGVMKPIACDGLVLDFQHSELHLTTLSKRLLLCKFEAPAQQSRTLKDAYRGATLSCGAANHLILGVDVYAKNKLLALPKPDIQVYANAEDGSHTLIGRPDALFYRLGRTYVQLELDSANARLHFFVQHALNVGRRGARSALAAAPEGANCFRIFMLPRSVC